MATSREVAAVVHTANMEGEWVGVEVGKSVRSRKRPRGDGKGTNIFDKGSQRGGTTYRTMGVISV